MGNIGGNVLVGLASSIALLFFYVPVILIMVLTIYALILGIKALKIYINKNS
ncbi:hypothetical protein [Anaeromicropila herbilytica]|uniref:Uncharacterized protein n=1 Tax=Anaeromicropila herbilytica TaxID=2785025 RepID=A0A7R7IF62_9FIRM|nr:hypothetical protein [Anaeromicropila herbilytica]BCN32839.1 hypothetical protein bsdtb5_41340 [Anaeromicropila herbilytica]